MLKSSEHSLNMCGRCLISSFLLRVAEKGRGGEKMKAAKARACINLHAVLRNLEDLCALDEESKAIIQGRNLAIRFSVKGVPKSIVTFADGKCTVAKTETGQYNMNLYFNSPDHFNQMIEGEKNPIPTKGFRHIGFL